MFKISSPNVVILVVLGLLGSMIGISFASEHIYLHKPCILHQIYRWFAIAVLLSMSFAFTFKSMPKFSNKLVSVSCIILFWGILITGVHILIQKGIIPESEIIKWQLRIFNNISSQEFDNITTLSCRRAELQILKFSISEIFCALYVFLFTYVSIFFQDRK